MGDLQCCSGVCLETIGNEFLSLSTELKSWLENKGPQSGDDKYEASALGRIGIGLELWLWGIVECGECDRCFSVVIGWLVREIKGGL